MFRFRSCINSVIFRLVSRDKTTHLMSTDLHLGQSPPEKRLRATITTQIQQQAQAQSQQSRQQRKHRKRKIPPKEPLDILGREAIILLQKHGQNVSLDIDGILDEDELANPPIATATEVELVVSELSSTGDSLSILPEPYKPWVIAVPFALPGERIIARIYRHGQGLSYGDLVNIEEPNSTLRDMSRVQCKYFGKCAGCQYQMLSYDDQLLFKQKVVDTAYKCHSGLAPNMVPQILPTIPSPKQYGYRTKITPHFDIPPKRFRKESNKSEEDRAWEVRIGFGMKGRRSVMDIEECPIATPVLNAALPSIRKNVQEYNTYKKGATLLLRDSLLIPESDESGVAEWKGEEERHVCVTEYHKPVRERVGDFIFEYSAGSFFQNNNSILGPLTSYVKDAVMGVGSGSEVVRPTHLVDAYCGSGLFSITLSPYITRVVGIEISKESIDSARHNANLNKIPESSCSFYAGQAEAIFENVKDFPPELTAVVVDPPRKGCDRVFLEQLMEFGPGTVVYVSCNVQTQARDLGILFQMEGHQYSIESIRGFDLFPQTAHVESVAVLRRKVLS